MIKKHLLNMTPFQMNKSQGSIYNRFEFTLKLNYKEIQINH